MRVKAEAFEQYGQAAILDRMLAARPAAVQSLAEPLGEVDKITVMSTGEGGTSGVHQATGGRGRVIAQAPAIVETLTELTIHDLGDRLPGPRDRTVTPAGGTGSATKPAV